jgi:hypothetical protein
MFYIPIKNLFSPSIPMFSVGIQLPIHLRGFAFKLIFIGLQRLSRYMVGIFANKVSLYIFIIMCVRMWFLKKKHYFADYHSIFAVVCNYFSIFVVRILQDEEVNEIN